MLDFGTFVFAFDELLLGCSSIAEVEVYGMEILHNERTIKAFVVGMFNNAMLYNNSWIEGV